MICLDCGDADIRYDDMEKAYHCNNCGSRNLRTRTEINYEKLAIKIGYSYLNGGFGYWEDGSGQLHSYDSMDNDYLKNCINFVDRGIEEVNKGTNDINNDIKKQLGKTIKEPKQKDIEYAKRQIVEILKLKRQELKECSEKRKSF